MKSLLNGFSEGSSLASGGGEPEPEDTAAFGNGAGGQAGVARAYSVKQ